ncbi:hypothetical protein D3C85_961850 [compost metagenome]
MVPHRFLAGFGNRERNTAIGAHDCIAVVGRLCTRRILERVVVDPLRCRGGAPRGIDIDPVARVFLQQCLLAITQLVGMLGHVRCSDRVHGLVRGEWIGARSASLVAGGDCGVAAGPGRDGAVLAGGALCAQRSELTLELGGFLCRDRSPARGCGCERE